MSIITLINPYNQQKLNLNNQNEEVFLEDQESNQFFRIKGAFRFVKDDNYTENFGFQWNKFTQTQVDKFSESNQSTERFLAVTQWDKENLKDKNILEVGSGAGRFSQVVLANTEANLYSVDYSNAVEANFKNNGHYGERLQLFQASIYEMPFEANSFDKVFCFGVLQHTPDFKKSVQSLINMAKPNAEVIVDFYPIKGWWTKIHAKYIFRPLTKKMNHEKLLRTIENNAGWMIKISRFFDKIGIGKLTNRFIPICDIKNTLPYQQLSKQELKEWVILDTFDMFSPEYDQPQRLETVKKWFEEMEMENVEAKFVEYGKGNSIAVVKGTKKSTKIN